MSNRSLYDRTLNFVEDVGGVVINVCEGLGRWLRPRLRPASSRHGRPTRVPRVVELTTHYVVAAFVWTDRSAVTRSTRALVFGALSAFGLTGALL